MNLYRKAEALLHPVLYAVKRGSQTRGMQQKRDTKQRDAGKARIQKTGRKKEA
jgi:hypothetical protein